MTATLGKSGVVAAFAFLLAACPEPQMNANSSRTITANVEPPPSDRICDLWCGTKEKNHYCGVVTVSEYDENNRPANRLGCGLPDEIPGDLFIAEPQ